MASWDGLDPNLTAWGQYLFLIAEYNNLHPVLTSGYRSIEKQSQLYDRYLRGEHAYPVAPPGRSAHNYGWAFDLTSDNNDALGALWEQWGGVWGGRFVGRQGRRDPIHFQLRR